PELDSELAGVCEKAMARDAKLRYSSGKELADELNRVLRATAAATRPESTQTAAPRHTAAPTKKTATPSLPAETNSESGFSGTQIGVVLSILIALAAAAILFFRNGVK